MKLLSCEYKGETFAAVSDGKKAYKAAPDMYALLDRLEGALPGPELLAGEGIDLGELRLLAPIPEPRQDVIRERQQGRQTPPAAHRRDNYTEVRYV